MNPTAFQDKVVIVTGASAGIGKALALRLAGQGAKVVIAARRAERLEQVASECRQRGESMLAVPTDVSDEAQCKSLIESTVSAFGRLDMLVNNAGLAASALFDDFTDLRLFKHVLDVNFYGTVQCTYHALAHLKQTRGRLLMISSLGGKAAIAYNTPYIASKYAMQGFCDSLRLELGRHGVSVTVVCPWWVVTEFHEAQLDKNGLPRGTRGRAFYTRNMMNADRCAELALEAARKRRREVWLGPGAAIVWLQLIAPGLLDWLAINLFFKPAARRGQARQVEVE